MAPVAVPGGQTFVALSVGGGGGFTCALSTDSLAYCWGLNFGGYLGTGDMVSSLTPRPVVGGLKFTAVSAGGTHACALTASGAAYCWGSNFYGQLGTGDTVPSTVPRPVAGGLAFAAVSAGGTHACALDADGAAYCWGVSSYHETGGSPIPVPVMSGVTFVAISGTADAASTCGLVASGTVHCWIDWGAPSSWIPWTVPGGQAFTTLSHGYGHSCAVTAAGVGYCWGRNFSGQLGIGIISDIVFDEPQKVLGQP
jgi:alpha-tubulin suppressor-like RCC1 family protein